MSKLSVMSELIDTWRQIDGKGPRHFINKGYDGVYRPCKSRVRVPDVIGLRPLYIEESQVVLNDKEAPLCKNCIKASARAKSSARMNQ